MKKTISLIFLFFISSHAKFLLSGDNNAQVFNNWVLKNNGNPWQALETMQECDTSTATRQYGETYIKNLKYKILALRALQAEHCFDDTKANEFIEKIQRETLNINDIKSLESEIEKSNSLLQSVETTKKALLISNNDDLIKSRSDALANKYNSKESYLLFDIIFRQLDEEIKNQQSNF